MGQNQVSLIERCPSFRESFFRGVTVYYTSLRLGRGGWRRWRNEARSQDAVTARDNSSYPASPLWQTTRRVERESEKGHIVGMVYTSMMS